MGYSQVQQIAKDTMDYATPNTTFEELYYHINGIIQEKGFINLDFLGNLGHSTNSY